MKKKNPGIKIKWVDIPYDAVIPKLLSAIATGDAPGNVARRTGRISIRQKK